MAISTHKGLNACVREIAILAVGAHFNCAYESYAHKSIAGLLGFSGPQIMDMSEGRLPEGITVGESAVYNFATAMLKSKEPVKDAMWEDTIALLGRESLMVLMSLVGVYSYVCMMLNAAAVNVPAITKSTKW
jgi:4-carboxymuconolactone decarboxylase